MRTKTLQKPYWEMTTAELREATKQYDKEFSPPRAIRPSAEELAQHRRFTGKMGRPRKGQGSKQIAITMERGLLRQVDIYAKRAGMTRSATIAAGVQQLLKKAV
jgi:ribosomal protein L21E